MSWARKKDGRPYADIFIDGKRQRPSILPEDFHGRADALTDEQCEKLYQHFIDKVLPTLQKTPPKPKPRPIARAVMTPNTKRSATIQDIRTYYTDIVLPAGGASDSMRRNCNQAFNAIQPRLEKHGVRTTDQLRSAPYVLTAVILELQGEYEPPTIKLYLDCFAIACRAAHRDKLIPRPIIEQWPKIKIPKRHYPDRPSIDAIARLFNELDKLPYGLAVKLMWFTGLRSIDIRRIEKARIFDLETESPYIHIIQKKTNQYLPIALAPEAADIVRRQLMRTGSSPYLFPNATGGQLSYSQLQRTLATALRRAELSHITLKYARQWVVSALIDAGKGIDAIAQVSGHKSTAYAAYYREKTGARHDLASLIAQTLKIPDNTTPTVTPLPKPKSNKAT